jgi:sulfate permease, SulP family
VPGRLVPVFEWLPRYRRGDLPGDVVAGLTGAAILIPQSMAYATIAGLPPVVGLYASVVPLLVYAVFGRSAPLGVGPLASISILSAVAVGSVAPHDSVRFIALSATLALLVGLVHVALGVGRLGFLMRFLSEPVMTGFLAAVGVLLIATQLGPITGLHVATSSQAYRIVGDWLHVAGGTDPLTAAIGVSAIVIMLVARRWRRFPTPLVLVVAAIVISGAFGLQHHGVAVVGHVSGGLAPPKVPPLHTQDVARLFPAALAITLISILESIAVAREYANRHGYEIITNQEITALGLANVSAGLFQGMVVTGAITRSSILEESGANTPLAGVVSAGVVLPVLLFATGIFRDLPIPILAAIVVVAVLPFVNVPEARRLWRVRRSDFWLMFVAFVASLALGIELGVAIAAAISITLIVYWATRPQVPELGRIPGTDYFLEVGRHPEAVTYPGTVILRVNSSLYFTNAESIEHRLRAVEAERRDLRSVVLDASGVDDLDSTADHSLRKLAAEYAQRGIALYVVNVDEAVRLVMDASGLSSLIGADHFFATDAEAVGHLDAHAGG